MYTQCTHTHNACTHTQCAHTHNALGPTATLCARTPCFAEDDGGDDSTDVCTTLEPSTPALESLVWHASDAAVKPIVANRRIERLPEPKFDAKALPFPAMSLQVRLCTGAAAAAMFACVSVCACACACVCLGVRLCGVCVCVRPHVCVCASTRVCGWVYVCEWVWAQGYGCTGSGCVCAQLAAEHLWCHVSVFCWCVGVLLVRGCSVGAWVGLLMRGCAEGDIQEGSGLRERVRMFCSMLAS